jgi:hypothetical protein
MRRTRQGGNGAAAAWRRQQDACSNGTAPKAADAALVDTDLDKEQ